MIRLSLPLYAIDRRKPFNHLSNCSFPVEILARNVQLSYHPCDVAQIKLIKINAANFVVMKVSERATRRHNFYNSSGFLGKGERLFGLFSSRSFRLRSDSKLRISKRLVSCDLSLSLA